MLSSIPGLYPLDARCTPLPIAPVEELKMSPDTTKCPLGVPTENNSSRVMQITDYNLCMSMQNSNDLWYPNFQDGFNNPHLLVFMFVCGPLPPCIRVGLCDRRIHQRDGIWFPRGGGGGSLANTEWLLSCCSLNRLLWGMPAAMSWASIPVERGLRWGTEVSCQKLPE